MKLNFLQYLSGADDFIKRIKRFIYSYKRNYSAKRRCNNSKIYLTPTATLELTSSKKSSAKKLTENAKNCIKKYINDPEALLEFVKTKGTTVIKAPHIEKVLILLGESEGFITPLKGVKAFILSLMIHILSPVKIKIGFSTPEMFIMRNLPVNIYFWPINFITGWRTEKNSPVMKKIL